MDRQPLSDLRLRLPPPEFRAHLRQMLVDNPRMTLRQAAQELGVTRQCVSQMVGPLGRPSIARPGRPAPKKDQAREKLAELEAKVCAGESAEAAARSLGISLSQAIRLGFQVKQIRASHGTQSRAAHGCDCWRCRRVSGKYFPRGPRSGPISEAAVLDWLAWEDPDTGEGLKQVEISILAGVGQGQVSRMVAKLKV